MTLGNVCRQGGHEDLAQTVWTGCHRGSWCQRGEVGHESLKFLKVSASRTQLASDQVHLFLIDLGDWSQWVLLDFSFATLSKGFDEP